MNRTIVLMLLVGAALATGAFVPQSAPLAAEAKKPELSVSIGVPEHYGKRIIRINDAASRFPVVVTNVSDKPQKVWREWCSWGWSCLSFEVTGPDGTSVTVPKAGRAWTKNFPDFWVLAPGDTLVLDVAFGSHEWEGFPMPEKGKSAVVRMKARFCSEEDWASKKDGVWTGDIASETREYVIENGPQ